MHSCAPPISTAPPLPRRRHFQPPSTAFTVTACLIGWPRRLHHWLIYFVGIPLLTLVVLYLRSMFLLLAIATFFTVLIADRFTCQTLYLGTTTPFDRSRARNIRRHWSRRFFSINTARGLEFYLLGIGVLLPTPWIFDSLVPEQSPSPLFSRFSAMLAVLGILAFLPAIIELIAALFYARRPLGIRVAWQAFKRSMTEWICYNHKEVAAPGLLQSPVGSSATRRRMLVAVICLWAAAINPLLSYQFDTRERIRNARQVAIADRSREREQQEALRRQHEEYTRPYWSPTLPGRDPGVPFPPASPDLRYPPPPETQTPRPRTTAPSASQPPTVELQPFQQRMLERMPAEQRDAYLQSLREQAVASSARSPENSDRSAPPTDAQSSPLQHRFKIASRDFFRDVMDPSGDELFSRGESQRVGLIFALVALVYGTRETFLLGLSFAFPLAFIYAASVRVAASLRDQLQTHPDTILAFGNWDRLVSDVTTSPDEVEQSSLLLGVNAKDNSPVLVPRRVFEEHAHILGDSGSGKTSMGISLILNQLIRQPDCSIVVIDLKGDDTALFTGTRLDAEAAGKRFRWFTNELGKSSYAFNPLAQEFFSTLSLYQKTDIITAALGLQYGTDYGRGYYSDANADYLYRTLQSHRNIRNFQQLARILPTGVGVNHITYETRRDASHLTSIVQRLAATEALNVTEDGPYNASVHNDRIDFADLFRTPQVIYLSLPSSLGTTSSAEIARIALYSLIASARRTPDNQRKQVFVFIDEFQRIIANNLELIMQTARSMKIGMILANQSMLDLKKQGTDITPAVRTNTRYKQVFAASNVEELKEMVEVSGEALVHQRSFSTEAAGIGGFFGGIVKIGRSEMASPRMRVNDVLLATDAPNQSIVQIRRGAGYAQYGGMPFVMRSTFHISEDEYIERKNFPWPDPVDGTLVGQEVEETTLIDAFPSVPDPIAGSHQPQDLARTASGAVDALDALFAAQQGKREAAKPQPPQPPGGSQPPHRPGTNDSSPHSDPNKS